MRQRLRYVFPVIMAAGAAAGALAPIAVADTTLINPTLPSCVDTGGSTVIGGQNTECATPGNVELNSTPEVPEDFAYPWGDEFYGPALIFGGPGPADNGGGGGHGGGGR
ncbi:hypothetical protein Y900_008530 [Mycolicibacterium aromaticivorans JS19b1 = JCM 16368]|uniref:Keratin associated protein n=1 Tax=Mycolicibacterium aromaticivorans JS19b1 = JCM 16368 TaxID=1440774 RepID=A0A064CJS9_9MYCO|nr:hypothetical protein [Mycolicibacterium aromaticivorans]KDE98993.1 hypothetical protein Y900_008530 [Mycolicibacterium aromaticivorans JS19b1 = JCM 16368]